MSITLDACACGARHQRSMVCDAIRTEARRDPTRTGRARQQLAREFERRWAVLRRLIRQAIVEQDFFGIRSVSVQSIHLVGAGGGQTQSFQAWIDSALLTTVVGRDNRWLLPWMQIGYQLGVDSATRAAHAHRRLAAPWGREEHLAAWAFIELQGIAEAVSQQAVRELSEGVLNRLRPAAIARNVIARVNAVGGLRTRLLAHHALVKAHATGTLDALETAGWAYVAVIPEAMSPTDPGRRRMGGPDKPGKRLLTVDARPGGNRAAGTRRARPNAKEQRRIERAQRRLEALRMVEVLTAGDDDVCPICEAISEDGPYAINRARTLIPSHPNCRCLAPGTSVEGEVLAASKSFYSGPMIEIKTAAGKCLRLTVNHPVVTERGILPAGLLGNGMQLVGNRTGVDVIVAKAKYEHNAPALIEDVFDSLASFGSVRTPTTAMDFHGDAEFVEGHVELVASDLLLLRYIQAAFAQGVSDDLLIVADKAISDAVRVGDLLASRSLGNALPINPLLVGLRPKLDAALLKYLDNRAAHNAVPRRKCQHRIAALIIGDDLQRASRADLGKGLVAQIGPASLLPSDGVGAHMDVIEFDAIGHSAKLDTAINQDLPDSEVINSVFASEHRHTQAGAVFLDEVVSINRFGYRGHVYDLQTATGFIIAEGLAVKNCSFVPFGDRRFAKVER